MDTEVPEIKGLKELISLRVQRGISIHPSGEVITLEITDRPLYDLRQLLHRWHMLQDPHASFLSSQPLSISSQPLAIEITNDCSAGKWEEMQVMISRESNMTINSLIVMSISGILSKVDIAMNALLFGRRL